MATFQEFRDEIELSLGGTLVDVEFEDSDYQVFFNKAKRTFKQKGHNSYRREYVPIDVVRTTRTYTLPSNVNEVTRIVQPNTSGFSLEDPMSMAIYNDLFTPTAASCSSSFDFLSYELTMGLMETFKRYGATDIEFDFDRFRKTVSILGTPKATGKCFVECYVDLEDEEYYEVDWIIRWAFAEAKETLGIAYRKFQSVASPQGDAGLGGDQLVNDAQREKEALLQEIENFVDGEIDFMPIRFG